MYGDVFDVNSKIDDSKLKSIKGDRGKFIKYVESDLKVNKKNVLRQGTRLVNKNFMITGIDYVFKTKKNSYFFFYVLEMKLKEIWRLFYKNHDFEDGVINVFYSKDEMMFNTMDDKGYNLDENGQGSFLVMFNESLSEKENRITLVLPGQVESSTFCEKVYEIVEQSTISPLEIEFISAPTDSQ